MRRECAAIGRGSLKRLAVFGEHLGKLGKSLGAASRPSTGPSARWSSRYCPPPAVFRSLGLRVNRDIEPIEPIESLARTPRADQSEREATGEPGSQDT